MATGGTTIRTMMLAGIAAACLAGGAAAAVAQATQAGGPVTYWMTAETSSGMAAMAAGGNGSAMVRAMMGGAQPAYSHLLQLQLGSGRRAAGEPSAEHLPPAGLKAGPSLPLVTPRAAPATETNWTGELERPKGRLLIYWGCGDHARQGQPVVVDFASLTGGKLAPTFATVTTLAGPAAGRHATYGEWPNQRSQTRVPANGSLVGGHSVRGNYTPDINFNVAQGNDFLAPVTLVNNKASAIGAVPLSWRAVTGSRAWFASAMGAADNGDMIMWSSSETQAMPMMAGYIGSDEIARLVQRKVLMPAGATTCTIPAEVAKAVPNAMLSLTAFGPEANYSHPERPVKAAASWRPDWTVKLLTKSSYMGMLGMDMSELMGSGARDTDEDEIAGEDAPQPKRKKALNPLKSGLKGLLGQ